MMRRRHSRVLKLSEAAAMRGRYAILWSRGDTRNQALTRNCLIRVPGQCDNRAKFTWSGIQPCPSVLRVAVDLELDSKVTIADVLPSAQIIVNRP
jgi:hypothetical protein